MSQAPGVETPLKYRADIDGLRAVAVLSVVLYHMGLPLHGGFVGVDIFFTISGFLIGSILLRDTAEGRFSIAGFYERRIRRIFPALFVMFFASVALASVTLLPNEFVAFAKSLAAATFSVSNFYFCDQSGYFDASAVTKPLLHTWSLAVEEQFYILLPIALVLLRRYLPRRVEAAIYALAAASFVAATVGAYRMPTQTFYSPHTRAWELLIGTMLALESCPKVRRPWARNAAGVLGLLLIAAPVLLYHPWTVFPGLAALPPCMGTALVIAAGRSGTNFAGRLLSLRPVVFVGLISYSLYLWHWPVIVFWDAGFTLINGLSRHQAQAVQLILSLLLAVLSWRLVELPFRTGRLRSGSRPLFAGAAIAMAAVAMLSFGVVHARGVGSRFPPAAQAVAAYLNNPQLEQFRANQCFITRAEDTPASFDRSACLAQVPGKKTYLLLGDSHAAALWWGFDRVLPDANIMQATASGCKPVLHQRPRQYATCTAIMSEMLTEYLPTHHVDAVLIAAHWDAGDLDSLGETLAYLHARHIPALLLGPIVQYDSDLPRLLAQQISRGEPKFASQHRLADIEPLDARMAQQAKATWDTPYISLYRLFCQRDGCTEYAGKDVPLLSDYGHLTSPGSVLAAQRIVALGVLP